MQLRSPTELGLTSLLISLLLAGCTTYKGAAPIVEREQPPSRDLRLHLVTSGETLYSIAFRYEKDFRDLASINGITGNYTISSGQKIYLTPEAAQAAGVNSIPRAVDNSSSDEVVVSTVRRSIVQTTAIGVPAPEPAPAVGPVARSPQPISSPNATGVVAPIVLAPLASNRWVWPQSGSIVRSFGSGDPVSKGIQISAPLGSPVVSVNDGVVVYSGSGLRGYGNLLIVKHDESHLSSYAFNQHLLAKEGDQVRSGQQIATVGTDNEGNNRLYFEIRVEGTPVDPIRFLPRR